MQALKACTAHPTHSSCHTKAVRTSAELAQQQAKPHIKDLPGIHQLPCKAGSLEGIAAGRSTSERVVSIY
jgi:hypothetical protein